MTGGRPARVRAPELRGTAWLNTGGADLSLADLRGRLVLLDFWTLCCVNCLHAIDELRPLEARWADVLTVVGVHSPKFPHETEHAAVADAVARHGIEHPVLDDPDLHTWRQYAAKAWPTLVLVDPTGRVVMSFAGEGHAQALDRLVAEVVAEHEALGTLRRGAAPAPTQRPLAPLRYPQKAVLLPDGTFLVADTGQHRLVRLAADLVTTTAVIGLGVRGRADGDAAEAMFAEPGGLCRLPDAVAAEVGYDVVVADTANHLLRGVRLADGAVTTVAGSGRPWRRDSGTSDLSSPWDVAWWHGRAVVAMAGVHQLWSFDPVTGGLAMLAGTTTEGLRDGWGDEAFLAQPSGLAPAGEVLWFVDAETSALRRLTVEGGRYRISTVVGEGLFDFGHRDGPVAGALLQHPLGVAALPDGSVAVADTYNGAVRHVHPSVGWVLTMADGLAEPSGLVWTGEDLVVVESAAHRLVTPVTLGMAWQVSGPSRTTRREATLLRAGEVVLRVRFETAPGQRPDDRNGPATRLEVSAPADLLAEGAGTGDEFERLLTLRPGSGVLAVTAQAAACDADGVNPACHLVRQDWGVPVEVVPGDSADAAAELVLTLRG